MPAKLGNQGADQIRTGVSDLSGLNGTKHHDLLVREIAQMPGVETRGFPRALRRILGSEFRFSLIPDAYRITDGLVEVWEVEITNPLTFAHLKKYGLLWGYLDCELTEDEEPWRLELFVVDRHGQESQVPVSDWYWRQMVCSVREQYGIEV